MSQNSLQKDSKEDRAHSHHRTGNAGPLRVEGEVGAENRRGLTVYMEEVPAAPQASERTESLLWWINQKRASP